jgi:hypothetical protein
MSSSKMLSKGLDASVLIGKAVAAEIAKNVAVYFDTDGVSLIVATNSIPDGAIGGITKEIIPKGKYGEIVASGYMKCLVTTDGSHALIVGSSLSSTTTGRLVWKADAGAVGEKFIAMQTLAISQTDATILIKVRC